MNNLSTGGWEVAAYSAPAVPPGTPLTAITKLKYSTYRPAGPGTTQIALQFTIDYDLTDGDNAFQGRLVYEPYYCNTVSSETWSTWNTLEDGNGAGCWWGSSISPRVGGSVVTQQCTQGNPCTWAEVKAAYPNAGFHPTNAATGLIFKAGSGWTGTFYADALVVGVTGTTTTYDFEPATPCTTTCYVNAVTGDDAFGGDTPSTAKKTIQAAVNQVSVGGTVIVAAGTYSSGVAISKNNITLQGAGIGSTVLQGSSCATTGIAITGDRTDITLRGLTVTGHNFGITTGNIGNSVSNITVEDLSASGNCRHGIWFQAGNSTNIAFTRVVASNNNAAGGLAGRGLWMINGVKANISIVDSEFSNNGLVGIDLSDGNATGVTITGNTVVGNGDAGIGVLGASGPLANIVSGNTVSNNGRFGIEIKMPSGNGLASGPGSVVVADNTVTRAIDATDARDYGGIVVIQRLSGNALVDALLPAGQPMGVFISGNTVSGFRRKASGSTGDGFGIVVEGTGHIVTRNLVSDNDVGVQIQAANPSINAQSTEYFDRGNAPTASALINRNSVTGNGLGLRNVGAPQTDVTCNWFGAASGPLSTELSGALSTAPWLLTSDLNGACPENDPPVVSNVAVSPNPAPYTTTSFALTATATDNVAVTAASYTIDGGSAVSFTLAPGTPLSFSATLGPLAVGVYELCVTAKDAANNTSNTECTMLAVYDPNAGFVTGGGWINSPAGAYVPNPELTGKATFGFVSKYLRGSSVPTGNTQFQFKAGDLSFSSTSYEWLVVSGARAQFRGAGTINGSGDYRFMLTVIDGQISGGGGTDKFRIRIWNNAGGGLVYDNQLNAPDSAAPTTVIGGGSIVIHVPK